MIKKQNILQPQGITLNKAIRFSADFLFIWPHTIERILAAFLMSCNKKNTPEWKLNLKKASFLPKNDEKDTKVVYQPVSKEHIHDLYAGMSKSGNNFKLRKGQVEFACHVADALNNSSVLTIEAGTGIWKNSRVFNSSP